MAGVEKESLLGLVEAGMIELYISPVKNPGKNFADICYLSVRAPEKEKLIQVAVAIREVFKGLEIQAFIKTGKEKGLDVVFPLGIESSVREAEQLSDILVRLIELKVPQLISYNVSSEAGKAVVKSMEKNGSLIIPYGLEDEYPSVLVSTPVAWEEVEKGLDFSELTPVKIFQRLEQYGDLWKDFHKNPIDAGEKYKELKERYGFLL
jgi:DNA primase